MNVFLTGATIFLLCALVYQDFRFRSVSWVLLPALYVLIFWTASFNSSALHVLKNSLQNSFFVLFQLGLVIIYFYVRKRSIKNFTVTVMGWGDILFFFAITPLCSLLNYILFLTGSMLLILLYYMTLKIFHKIALRSHAIPLAGILAALLIVLQLLQLFYPPLVNRFNSTISIVF